MALFFTTHLPHLDGAPPGPATDRARALTDLVAATTSVAEDSFVEGVSRCPGRGGQCRRGVVAVRFDTTVRWLCPTCKAAGVVTGWEGTSADRRVQSLVEEPMDPTVLRGPVSSWPKISGAFTAFARPALEAQPPVAEQWKLALVVPATVWNAVVLADFGGNPAWLAEVVTRVAGHPAGLLTEVLIARKRRLFSADFRTVEVDSVKLVGATMWVNVTARDGRG